MFLDRRCVVVISGTASMFEVQNWCQIFESEDAVASHHRWMRTALERKHADVDVRTLVHHGEMVELRSHHLRIAHDAMEHRLIDDRVELCGLLRGQDGLATNPQVSDSPDLPLGARCDVVSYVGDCVGGRLE